MTFKDGSTTLGTGTISGTTATYSTSALTAGAHSITAVYGGDGNNATATSTAITVTVAIPVLNFSPAAGELPAATANSPYNQSVTASASGSTQPIRYAVTAGSLPTGLALDAGNGVISGTPTTPGSYSFTITATDSAVPPSSGSASYTMIVRPVATFAFSPAGGALPEAMSGENYSQQFSVTGGNGTLIYSIASGRLPPGMVLNASTGELTGPLNADTEGDYSFTIQVRDSSSAVATVNYTLRVAKRAVTVNDKQVNLQAGSAPTNINLAAGATGWAL